MRYIIKREDGAYVARPGERHSYTYKLQHARRFDTRELAESERCGNERVLSIEEELGR